MKCNFSAMFDRAYKILTSGKYGMHSRMPNIRFYESELLKMQNRNFPFFKIGTSLTDQYGRNIYVQRYANEAPKRFVPVLALMEEKSASSNSAYLFSHGDYSLDTFQMLSNPREIHSHGTGLPGQDLSQDAYYVRNDTMFSDFVDLARWRKDTLKYIRDAIKRFAEGI